MAALGNDPVRSLHDQSIHVEAYALVIGQQMGLPPRELQVLGLAARLHDSPMIGAQGTAEHVRLQVGHDVAEQWLRQSPDLHELRKSSPAVWAEAEWVLQAHCERHDGTGAPQGLRGEEIPLLARILSLADFYDAFVSPRGHRFRVSHDVTCMLIARWSGRRFDSVVAKAFLAIPPVRWPWDNRDFDGRP
jgi:HD-GYP domain-containing protein (c-di-GMP phosphodiesterase class II)